MSVLARALVPRRVRRTVRALQKRWTPRGLVLMYHRVGTGGADPWGLAVSPAHFAEHLAVLKCHMRPMGLEALTAALDAGRLPRRAVAVTFDDGYADNLHEAVPILDRYDVPATVFVATGYLGGQREFWWDALEQLLLHDDPLPGTLHLTVGGAPFDWADDGKEASPSSASSWRCWEDPVTARQALYRALWKRLQLQPEAEQWTVLDALAQWAGLPLTARPALRALTHDEVTALADRVDVGAHTVSHPSLSALPLAAQRDEIMQSKACLEEVLGRPVPTFSYPFGEYGPETVVLVREAGFACACSTESTTVRGGADRFQLPRLYVEDWEGDVFERTLQAYLQPA